MFSNVSIYSLRTGGDLFFLRGDLFTFLGDLLYLRGDFFFSPDELILLRPCLLPLPGDLLLLRFYLLPLRGDLLPFLLTDLLPLTLSLLTGSPNSSSEV